MRAPGSQTPAFDLTARIGSVVLPNPVMTAAGTSGHGAELASYFDLSELGAVVVKSVSAEPWAGNEPPRLLPLRAGMMNSVGLQNRGVAEWLSHELPALAATGARVVVSVWGRSPDDYAEVGRRLAGALVPAASAHGPGSQSAGERGRVVAVEANISCPNVEDRHRMFAHTIEGTSAAISSLWRSLEGTGLPVWAKLSPNVTDIVAIAGAALSAGAEALVLVNTLMGLALDPASGVPLLGAGGGGVSGPGLHPVAVRAVHECRTAFPDAPIVGVGGVLTGADAAEMLVAGAQAVQVGTATFADPRAPVKVLRELTSWCRSRGLRSAGDLRPAAGWAHAPLGARGEGSG
ncbi:MAG TPA: dihydroorotate dehydrogenase [Acidimicrobiales bacterium]|nr:dihydroorotate dehydrogenase [Acidimicrobiales bacterium]